jgi:hypothetical protein
VVSEPVRLAALTVDGLRQTNATLMRAGGVLRQAATEPKDHEDITYGRRRVASPPARLRGTMSAMPRVGTPFLAAISMALITSLVACGDDSGRAALSSTGADSHGLTGEPFPLPFGLVQLDGTAAIGRPVVYDHEPYTFNNVPVRVRSLRAAYRVTADDAVDVFRRWVGQLDGLALGEVCVRAGTGPAEPWVQASNCDYAGGDYADIQLWATGTEPILLVSLQRTGDDPARAPTVHDDAGNPPAPRSVVDDTERTAGDQLFSEQGDVLHLPEGTRALMPTIPTFGGTGGSTSVLAAEDGEAAVNSLLDEAVAISDYGEVTDPVISEVEGMGVAYASFVITAGGWGFDVVMVTGPDDPYATVYVVSSAD